MMNQRIQKPANNNAATATLNKRELTSIYALVAYAAYHRNIAEEVVQKTVNEYFGVTDVTQLPSQSYNDVIKFLIDVQVDMLLN